MHDVTLIRGIEQRDATVIAEMKTRNPPVIHPVARTHPETGRKSLFVNQRIRRFIGMSDEESQSLLAMQNTHATSPEFVYRHRWSLGDVVMWDNRCSVPAGRRDRRHRARAGAGPDERARPECWSRTRAARAA